MENLRDLVIFLKVVEAGGISAAATTLNMSPSLVSRRLRHLEEELGVQLINRSTRHISLTEAGESFHRDCVPAIAAIEAARVAAIGLSDEPRGTLKIHAAVGVGQWLVTEAAATFKQNYPDVAVDLYVDSDRENLLRDGYDIIIKTSHLSDSSLECREFSFVRHVVVASPLYLERAGAPSQPKDLVEHECLIQYGRRPPGEWHFTGPQGDYSVQVAGGFRSTSAVSICKAATRGLGIALVPEYVVYGQPCEADLSVVFDECVAPKRSLVAYYPLSPHLPAKLRAFLDCLELADLHRQVATVLAPRQNRA